MRLPRNNTLLIVVVVLVVVWLCMRPRTSQAKVYGMGQAGSIFGSGLAGGGQ